LLVYHPPRPKYQPNTLLDRLCHDVEYLTGKYPTATVYIIGDFNHLSISQLLSDNGLHQVVAAATRGANTLDLFITNRPNEVTCSVVKSCMHTDHRALLVNSLNSNLGDTQSRRTVSFYDIRKPNIDALALELQAYDWNRVLHTTDIDTVYERFLPVIADLISRNIPRNTITLRDSTPTYITPLIKYLLRKRNKLMRRNKTSEAGTISVKVGKLIAETRAQQLSKLWASVRSTTAHNRKQSLTSAVPLSANDFVDFSLILLLILLTILIP